MRGGVIRAALMLLAGLGLAMAALLLVAPSTASAETAHAHHGAAVADAADGPVTAPAPAPGHSPSHDKACCTVAACPMMHIALPAVWVAGPRAVVGVLEPVRAMPAPHGLDRPPPLPPPRLTV
ncbi:hypothetical protein HL658_33025 [Azospirillum sp. RWY-5-1]|nr:hypothetical protein [Azospirillum oleiclasticum]